MGFNLSYKKYFLLSLLLFCSPSNSKNQEYFSNKAFNKNNQAILSEIKLSSNENVESVFVIGSGLSIEEAIQNASVKALKQVSGELIDTETNFKSESNYKNDRLIDEKETFNEKLRDYSQGSIKSYEILKFIHDL